MGQDIKVYIDHKNLMYNTYNSARIMQWRLAVKEFSPALIYIPGTTNIIADTLSPLPMRSAQEIHKPKNEEHACAGMHALHESDLPLYAHPLSYKVIMKNQQEDKNLLNTAKHNIDYIIKDSTVASCTCK